MTPLSAWRRAFSRMAAISRTLPGQECWRRRASAPGPRRDGALLIAGADAVKEELNERGDVFTALAKRRDGKANRSEAKREVGKEQSLTGHLAQRSLRGGEQDSAAGRTVLKVFEDAEEQALAGRGEKVDAIEIGEAGEGGGIGVGGEPLAGVAALKCAGGEGRATEEITGKGVLAGAMLALDGGNLQVGRGHFCLHEELAPGCADADDMDGGGGGIKLHERKAGGGGLCMEWSGAMHEIPTCLASGAKVNCQVITGLIGEVGENMNGAE